MTRSSSKNLHSFLRSREYGSVEHSKYTTSSSFLNTNTNPPCPAPTHQILGALRTTPEDEFSFWNVEPPNPPQAIPPFTISFSTTALDGHALLAADEDGVVTILDTRRSLHKQLHAWQHDPDRPPARFRAHDNAIFDSIWMNNDEDIATASGDTSLRIFNVERQIRKATCRGASGSLKAVRNLFDSPYVLATAARDGSIRVYDMRSPTFCDAANYAQENYHLPIFQLKNAHSQLVSNSIPSAKKRRRVQLYPPDELMSGSVTALVTVPNSSHFFFTAGAADGMVKLWDIRKFGPRDEDPLVIAARPGDQKRLDCQPRRRQYGLAALDIDASGQHLIASGTDSSIYMYDVRNMDLGYTSVLTGHTQTSFYIRAKFSPCGRFVASGSADSKVYLWDTYQNGEKGRLDAMLLLDGHRDGDAAGVDWCKTEPFKMVTCADDSTAKVWRVHPGCSAGGVKEEGDEISMGARKVRAKRQEIGCEKLRVKNRNLKDSDIRSFFQQRASCVSDELGNVKSWNDSRMSGGIGKERTMCEG